MLLEGSGVKRNKLGVWGPSRYKLLYLYKIDKQSKLYLKLHEVNSLLSENCKMGHKAGNFYALKNKRIEAEKWEIFA